MGAAIYKKECGYQPYNPGVMELINNRKFDRKLTSETSLDHILAFIHRHATTLAGGGRPADIGSGF